LKSAFEGSHVARWKAARDGNFKLKKGVSVFWEKTWRPLAASALCSAARCRARTARDRARSYSSKGLNRSREDCETQVSKTAGFDFTIHATAAWFTNRDPRFGMGFFQRLLQVN
jgi:hypothetical protein